MIADINTDARRAVIRRYARLTRDGTPIFCTPKQGDELRPRGLVNAGKAYYPSVAAADAARIELERLGAAPMRVIECWRRGRHGRIHYHLKSR